MDSDRTAEGEHDARQGTTEDRRSEGGRALPVGPEPPDEERVALYESTFAYAGTYSLEDGRVTHHVDVSSNEVWRGTEQARFYKLNGSILTITARLRDRSSGMHAQYLLVREKVTGPR